MAGFLSIIKASALMLPACDIGRNVDLGLMVTFQVEAFIDRWHKRPEIDELTPSKSKCFLLPKDSLDLTITFTR